MKKISIKSPTRVDLAGGTLDLWPLYNFVGGATTVNVAINTYSHASTQELHNKEIVIESKDLNYKKSFPSLDKLLQSSDAELNFYKPIIKFFTQTIKDKSLKGDILKNSVGMQLTTSSESPVGAGLGGSSSLLISCLKALYDFFSLKPPTSSHEMVQIAHNLEAEMLLTPTGTQDYYPAYSGGLNILNYTASEIGQQCFSIKELNFSDNFMLIYTGRSHHSGINNFEVLKSAVQKDAKILSALANLKYISECMAQVCVAGDWEKIPELFEQEYRYRVQLTDSFSSPEIKKLKEVSNNYKGSAVKICGAGGGGCVLFWIPPKFRGQLQEECQRLGFQVLNSQPVDL